MNMSNRIHQDCDRRPAKGSWAPGNYMRRCSSCRQGFIGDKRAVMCADCAYAANHCRQCNGTGVIRQPNKPEDLRCRLCSGRGLAREAESNVTACDIEDAIALEVEKELQSLQKRGILVPFCDSHDRDDIVQSTDGEEICGICCGDFSGELCHLGCDSTGYDVAHRIMKLPIMRAALSRLTTTTPQKDA